MPGSNCCFLTGIQVFQDTSKVVWYSTSYKNCSQAVMIHTVKAFSTVKEAEVDVLLEFLCFFYDSVDVCNLIYGSSALSKASLNIWKLTVHILLKSGLENFGHCFASVWNDCNYGVVWAFFWHCPFFGIGMKTTFSSPVATAEFSKFAGISSAALSQHHLSGFRIAQLEFHHIH